jgi:transcriptional regulator with XRE-family HTH domain
MERMVMRGMLLGARVSPTTRTRLTLGLTREMLAFRSGLSVSTVATLEKGGRVAPDTLARVAAILGVPPEKLKAK